MLINNNHVEDRTQDMLTKLSCLWESRAAVNQNTFKVSELIFDEKQKDFSEELLPFVNHCAWKSLEQEKKDKCLSYAWGLYNLKTIYIECDIVTPVCEDVIKFAPSSHNPAQLQDVISQALLDEALHTRMSLLASNYIYFHRNLKPLTFSNFNLLTWREKLLSEYSSPSEKRLVAFGIACASETLITDYLKVMAEDNKIQRVCHEVTRTHAIDEWSHSSVFTLVAIEIIKQLRPSERNILCSTIKRTVHMFADNELEAWQEIFKTVGILEAQEILADTGSKNEIGIYTGSVSNLLSRLGFKNEVSWG